MNVSKTIPMFPEIRLTNRRVRRREKGPEKCQSRICVSNENLTNIHTLVSFAVWRRGDGVVGRPVTGDSDGERGRYRGVTGVTGKYERDL